MSLLFSAVAFIFSVVINSNNASAAETTRVTSAILVDKKTNQLFVSDYVNGEFFIKKTYHTTLGQVQGDKVEENDLKTPEGIYVFKAQLRPPNLQRKFGVMAFYMNFPNSFDQIAGAKGNGIMLHATDEPERLKRNYDSQGCVVVKNEELTEIAPSIRLGLTPILVFPELTPDFMKPGKDTKLQNFFRSWIDSWEKKDVERYINYYHEEFVAQGMNKARWKTYKSGLNSKYSEIAVNPETILYYRHPKYSMITFKQNYRSKLKNGRPGFASHGTKILYVAEESGEPKIIAETFTGLMW